MDIYRFFFLKQNRKKNPPENDVNYLLHKYSTNLSEYNNKKKNSLRLHTEISRNI